MSPEKIMDAWSVIVAMFLAMLILVGVVEGVKHFGRDVEQSDFGDLEIIEEMIIPS